MIVNGACAGNSKLIIRIFKEAPIRWAACLHCRQSGQWQTIYNSCWLNSCLSGRRSLKITWAFITKSYLRSAAAARFLFFSEDLPDADLQRCSAFLQKVNDRPLQRQF